MRWYSSDRKDHLADITFQTAKLETLIYDDYLWTLKVQNSGNTDNKVLIYADYSSGLILDKPKTTQETQQSDSNDTLVSKGYVDAQIAALRSELGI